MLAEETQGLFVWQFGDGACPEGCERAGHESKTGGCVLKKGGVERKDEL